MLSRGGSSDEPLTEIGGFREVKLRWKRAGSEFHGDGWSDTEVNRVAWGVGYGGTRRDRIGQSLRFELDTYDTSDIPYPTAGLVLAARRLASSSAWMAANEGDFVMTGGCAGNDGDGGSGGVGVVEVGRGRVVVDDINDVVCARARSASC